MAQYNFEGDVNGISERQLEFINSVIQEHGFENSKVTFEPVGKAGDNYAASVKRIIIEGENERLTMIAKIAPTNEVHRQLMNSGLLFKNEHIMYSEFLPKLVQLQKDAGIPEKEQLKYARCYGSFGEQPNEVILLEDLKTLGFTMLDRFKSLPNDCVMYILKNFAMLHSLSFTMRYKEPETYDYFKTNLKDTWALQGDSKELQMFFDDLVSETISILEDADHKNVVRQMSNSIKLLSIISKADSDSKHSVIVQGDSWTNNIMFRFEDDNLAESIMIDYQLSRNSSPVNDILYMIFNCTDHETRKQHFHDWIDYYHSELDKALSDFGLKANFIYSRDKLDADLKRYGKIMFGLSICLNSILIRKSEDAAKVMELMKEENAFENSQQISVSTLDDESINLFKNRVLGLIYSCTEFGLL